MIRFTISGILAALGIVVLIAAWLCDDSADEQYEKDRQKRLNEQLACIDEYYAKWEAKHGLDGPQGSGGPTFPPDIPRPMGPQDFMIASAVLFGLALLFLICGFIPVGNWEW